MTTCATFNQQYCDNERRGFLVSVLKTLSSSRFSQKAFFAMLSGILTLLTLIFTTLTDLSTQLAEFRGLMTSKVVVLEREVEYLKSLHREAPRKPERKQSLDSNAVITDTRRTNREDRAHALKAP